MKRYWILSALLSITTPAIAAEFSATEKVQKIFSLDTTQYGADADQILIAGFASAGTCKTNDGLIALSLRDGESGKRQLSVALAAKLNDRPVTVRVNDAIKNATGQCYLKYLELN